MKPHSFGGMFFLIMAFLNLAQAETFTKVGPGAIECADRITFSIRLIDQYTVQGDDAIALKKIINRFIDPEWWVTNDDSGRAALPATTFSLYRVHEGNALLILRMPVAENLKEGAKYEDLVKELQSFVESRKLPRSTASSDPNDHVRVQKMK